MHRKQKHGNVMGLRATFWDSNCEFQCYLVPDYIPEQSCGHSPLVTILEGAATR